MLKKVHFKLSALRLVIIVSLAAFCFSAALSVALVIYFQDRFMPNTFVGEIQVGALKRSEAIYEITKSNLPQEFSLIIRAKETQSHSIPLEDLGIQIDIDSTVQTVLTSQSKNFGHNIFRQKYYDWLLNINHTILEAKLGEIALAVSDSPEDPSLVFNNGITVSAGKAGYLIDHKKLAQEVIASVSQNRFSLTSVVESVDPTLSQSQTISFRSRGEKIYPKTLTLKAQSQEFGYSGQELLNILSFNDEYRLDFLAPSLEDLKTALNSPPKNPVFEFVDSEHGKGRVEEFEPAQDGLELNVDELKDKITKGLRELENTEVDEVIVEIPFTRTPPEFQTSDVNNLGIRELIGTGVSNFRGSISSRIHNINLAASRLNGVLIAPGATFSFTNTLGDISALTGYKQAYVIQGNQTVLGDGGGVCQVSTTFFRAALAAGLPIVERHAHSYRVGYYEQGSPPGIDATIYYPSVDIKIRNDTPGHILVQTIVDAKTATLKFDLYGTSDGRVATISKPVVTQVVAPPEDLYMDDPTLPTGQVNQIDYKAWGAKVSFDYTVVRNGETIFEDSFYSNYRPWQAKFLRGTGPAQ